MSDDFFKVWFIFCAAITLAMLGLTAWAVIALIQWVTTK